MTTTYPALHGNFGTTEYCIITMRVSELVRMIQFPSDVPGWEDRSIEERFQRNLDITRINRDIAPYFAGDAKRFSGSLVVAAHNPDGMAFESIHDVVKNGTLPVAYKLTTEDLGFVTLNDQKLIPLDGQHRAKAFQTVMKWIEHPESRPANISSDNGLGEDKVAIILVKFDRSLSRYIFNKINKYARPTSKAGKLITDDDDSMAVITRRLVESGPIPRRLINIDANSLNKTAFEFTLISTFHDANKALLSCLPIPSVGKPEKMSDLERDKRQVEIAEEWNRLITGIGKWKKALNDPQETGDKARTTLREKSLLGRPIGQLALVKGYAHACILSGRNIDRKPLVRKLDSINWDMDAGMWKGVLVKPNGKVMYGVRVANIAAKLIAHLIGAKLPKTDVERILDCIYGTKRRRKSLPVQI